MNSFDHYSIILVFPWIFSIFFNPIILIIHNNIHPNILFYPQNYQSISLTKYMVQVFVNLLFSLNYLIHVKSIPLSSLFFHYNYIIIKLIQSVFPLILIGSLNPKFILLILHLLIIIILIVQQCDFLFIIITLNYLSYHFFQCVPLKFQLIFLNS